MAVFSILLMLLGLLADSPSGILRGLCRIITESGILITDYIAVGGIGAAFVNAGLLMLIAILMLFMLKVDINGISIASVFLMGSFALFGKNIFNVWLIILGVFLYAKLRGEKFKEYVHIAFLATSIAPIVTELLFVINMPLWFRIPLSIMVGASIGFLIPPLSSHMLKLHKGFNLYNIGFTVGILGTVYVSVFKSYGYVTYSKMVWSSGNDMLLGIFLTGLFLALIATGVALHPPSIKGIPRIFRCSGQLISDFTALEGFEATLINMGLNGMVAIGYVLLTGAPLNGPTIGGILTVVGFGAFGKHIKNIMPVLLGVFIGSLTKLWSINDPPILLAALFGTALGPIAGHYGWIWGVAAGFINSSVVLNSGILHGGMNLYNTGFSAGIVAAIMVPILDTFRNKKTKVYYKSKTTDYLIEESKE